MKNSVKNFDDVFSSKELSTLAPKYDFPKSEMQPNEAYQIIHDEIMIDGNSRLNLATFCSTYIEKEVHKLMDESIDKNMIDKDEYPQTAEIERRCVHMLAKLWNSPEPNSTLGCSTTGSSEAAMLGGLAMKHRHLKKMHAKGKKAKQNIVTGPVQICWHKFARYFDVEIREVPMSEGNYTSKASDVIKYCDENTIGVVATLGTTFTLQYENVLELAKVLDEYEKETSIDIPIHVDGASGGFLAPFIEPELKWDFRIERVKSINGSGHKFGLSPLGVGWVVWRTKADLPQELIFYVNYLGGQMATFALNFSRPGGQVIAQYYNFIRLGMEGYKKIHSSCYDAAEYFAKKLETLGIFDLISHGKKGVIPGVCWKLKDDISFNFSLYDIAERLRYRGWQVPAYSLPKHCEHIVIQRVLVRHGVSKDLLDLLFNDLVEVLKFLSANEISRSATNTNSGFHH